MDLPGFPKSDETKTKKIEMENEWDAGQKVTATGGAAINTAVFVQNANQLRKLFNPEFCSVEYSHYQMDLDSGESEKAMLWINGTYKIPAECDDFSQAQSFV